MTYKITNDKTYKTIAFRLNNVNRNANGNANTDSLNNVIRVNSLLLPESAISTICRDGCSIAWLVKNKSGDSNLSKPLIPNDENKWTYAFHQFYIPPGNYKSCDEIITTLNNVIRDTFSLIVSDDKSNIIITDNAYYENFEIQLDATTYEIIPVSSITPFNKLTTMKLPNYFPGDTKLYKLPQIQKGAYSSEIIYKTSLSKIDTNNFKYYQNESLWDVLGVQYFEIDSSKFHWLDDEIVEMTMCTKNFFEALYLGPLIFSTDSIILPELAQYSYNIPSTYPKGYELNDANTIINMFSKKFIYSGSSFHKHTELLIKFTTNDDFELQMRTNALTLGTNDMLYDVSNNSGTIVININKTVPSNSIMYITGCDTNYPVNNCNCVLLCEHIA